MSAHGLGQASIPFKDSNGNSVNQIIALTNGNLEKLEMSYRKTFPNSDFTLRDFFLSEYSPLLFKLALLTCSVDKKFDEAAYKRLIRNNPGELTDEWEAIQLNYARWSKREDIIELITGQAPAVEEEEDSLGNS